MNVNPGQPLDEYIAQLVSDIGLPSKLCELGVSEDQLSNIARKASQDHLSITNPKPANEADYLHLLKQML